MKGLLKRRLAACFLILTCLIYSHQSYAWPSKAGALAFGVAAISLVGSAAATAVNETATATASSDSTGTATVAIGFAAGLGTIGATVLQSVVAGIKEKGPIGYLGDQVSGIIGIFKSIGAACSECRKAPEPESPVEKALTTYAQPLAAPSSSSIFCRNCDPFWMGFISIYSICLPALTASFYCDRCLFRVPRIFSFKNGDCSLSDFSSFV